MDEGGAVLLTVTKRYVFFSKPRRHRYGPEEFWDYSEVLPDIPKIHGTVANMLVQGW